MKSVLLFIFNLARNVSLLLVILLFCCAIYLIQHPEEATKLLNQDAEIAFSAQALEEDEIVSSLSLEVIETNKNTRKLALSVKGGTAYLRPSQVMYVDNGILVTTNLREIGVSTPLYQVFSKFQENNENFFFQTKSSIINCHYVLQIISRNDTNNRESYNYKHYVVMEDGKEINISKEMSKELKSILYNINI